MSHIPTTAEVIAAQQARQAVLAKCTDTAGLPITEDDCKHLTGNEINELINLGRVPGVGADKRLARRR